MYVLFIDINLIYNIVLVQVYSVEIQYFIDSLKSYYKIMTIVLLSPFLTSKSPEIFCPNIASPGNFQPSWQVIGAQ